MKTLAIIILIILLIYFGSKLFSRYFLTWFITKIFERQIDDLFRQYGADNEEERNEDVKMSSKPHGATKTDDKSFGEYIDFEEIKDNEKSESDE